MAKNWGKGHVRQRGDRFRAEIMIDGQRVSKSFEKETDAKRWLEVTKADAIRGVLQIEEKPQELRFDDLARLFIQHKRARWRPATLAYYLCHLKGVLLPAFGSRFVSALAHLELQHFLDEKLAAVKPTTVNIYRQILSAVFAFGVRAGMMKSSPMRFVEKARRTGEEFDGRALRLFEVQALLRNSRPEDRPFFVILLFTGLRRAEIFRMTWEWVNLRDKVLHVRIGKTGSADLPMARCVVDAFKSMGPKDAGLVFPGHSRSGKTHTEQPMTSRRKTILSALERAGINPKGIGMHTFRRTYLTLLEETGAPYGVVRRLARHGRRPSDITGLYLKPSDEQLRAALERLATAVEAPPTVVPLRVVAV